MGHGREFPAAAEMGRNTCALGCTIARQSTTQGMAPERPKAAAAAPGPPLESRYLFLNVRWPIRPTNFGMKTVCWPSRYVGY